MYKEKPEFVTHCPRGHPRKFQLIDQLSKTDMRIMLRQHRIMGQGDSAWVLTHTARLGQKLR